jgi:ElaB/YqjD/DUF883 family membrane-anchored ribosome-binding protein
MGHVMSSNRDLRRRESEIGASLYEGAGIVDEAKSFADGVSRTATQAYDAGAQMAGAVSERVSSIAHGFESAVRRNPMVAVAAALGVGLVIGLMSRR